MLDEGPAIVLWREHAEQGTGTLEPGRFHRVQDARAGGAGRGPPPFVGSFEDAPSSSYADAQRMHHQICSASDRIAGVFLSMVEP